MSHKCKLNYVNKIQCQGRSASQSIQTFFLRSFQFDPKVNWENNKAVNTLQMYLCLVLKNFP